MYDHYTAIYYLLLDRLRHHRSSFPSDTRVDARRRRPSTIAEQAMLQNMTGRPLIGTTKHGGFSRTLDAPGAGTVLVHRNYPLTEVEVIPPAPNVPHCMTEVLPKPFSKPSQVTCGSAVAGGSVITTSIDEGVEVDIMDRRDSTSDVESVSEMGIGYTSRTAGSYSGFGLARSDLSSSNSGGRKQSCNSVVSGTLSPCTSIDSSLGVDFSTPFLPALQLPHQQQQQQQQQTALHSPTSSYRAAAASVGLVESLNCGGGGGNVTPHSESSSQHLLSLYPSAMLSHLSNVSGGGGASRHGRYSISGPSAALPMSLHPEMPCGNHQFLQVTAVMSACLLA